MLLLRQEPAGRMLWTDACYLLCLGKIIDGAECPEKQKADWRGRCAVTLGGKSHYYHGSESAKEKFKGWEEIFFGARGVSRISLVLLRGFGGEKKHIKYTWVILRETHVTTHELRIPAHTHTQSLSLSVAHTVNTQTNEVEIFSYLRNISRLCGLVYTRWWQNASVVLYSEKSFHQTRLIVDLFVHLL